MRIVDKNVLTELDYLWITIGVLQAKAWLADRQNEDIQIEAGFNVVEALQKQGAAELGELAYYLGIKLMLDHSLSAIGKQVDETAKYALMMKIGEVSLVKVSVTQEKRNVEKTTMIEHDKAGRIVSFIKEQVQI